MIPGGRGSRTVWQLYLGRKAFVPAVPVFMPDGLKLGVGLEKALTDYPWRLRPGLPIPPELRLVLEADAATGEEVRRDIPLCFESPRRQFALRHVQNKYVKPRIQQLEEV